MIKVGDTVRVKAPDVLMGMSEGWRGSIGWVGTVHDIGRNGFDTYTVTFGENAKDGFWTYPACGLERVEPEAPAAESGGDMFTRYGIMREHLDAALVSLREALAVSSRAGGSYRQVEAICQMLGHVDRCVRELPE